MTDDDYDALSQKQLASIKRDMRISLEDAAVRATYKVMAELAQPDQDEVDIRSRLYQRIHELETQLAQRPSFRYGEHPTSFGLFNPKQSPLTLEWVGLTYEDQEEIVLSAHSIRDAINKTDQKLKEKNT